MGSISGTTIGATEEKASQAIILPDSWTVFAIAAIAYALASFIHEGIGHGGICLLSGGKPLALSSVYFDCSNDSKWVDAGGTFANLFAGAIFGLASRTVTRSTHLRYFLWLSMSLNLLQAGGYFLYSGVANIGDWADVIQGLRPAWLYRVGLVILGVISYTFFIWLVLRELTPLLPKQSDERIHVAKRLTLWPYIFGGILSCVAGLFNPVGMILVAISAAAASFGGTSGLAWMWKFFRGDRVPVSGCKERFSTLTRSNAWIVAGVSLAVLFVAVLGPGIKFHG